MHSSPKLGAKSSARTFVTVSALFVLAFVSVDLPTSEAAAGRSIVAQASPATRPGSRVESGRRGGVLRGKDLAPANPGGAEPQPSGATEPESPEESEPAAPLGTRIRTFIKENVTWILAGLLVVLGIAVIWTFVGARSGKSGSASLGDLGFGESPVKADYVTPGTRKFSSTRIQTAEVGQRLSGVKSTQVETDREYALVVDEEALKRPPIPQSESGEHFAPSQDVERIRQLLNSERYLDAYQEYARILAEDRKRVIPSDMERALAEFLMGSKEYDRAAKVLGHHVASHPAKQISADTYFNLGYIHFMRRSLDKARRFLKLFTKVEQNPEYVARARKILEKIDGPRRAS